ncbi:LamG domain-containing protein [Streptomyces sp. NPDC018000]|uniref:LamG domain-containing protein n=1 Tax=Streptomyces sp. NPDC018000 TaxID=3365028 RepID=UPI0037B9F8B8
MAAAALGLIAVGVLTPQATAAGPVGSDTGGAKEAVAPWSPAGAPSKPSGSSLTADLPQMAQQDQAVKGRWQFEETTPGTPASTPDAAEQSPPMNLYREAQIGPGWIDNGGLQLNGADSYAEVPAVPVDTSSSFTVTSWAQASALPDHPMTVINAAGNTRSAFELRFKSAPGDPEGFGRWELTLPDADSAGAVTRQVTSTEFDDVRDWNHLAVVYDSLAKQARLYVNGILQEFRCADDDGDGRPDDSTCQDEVAWADDVQMFKADGPLQVGRAMSDTAGEYFAGTIDDVWVFQGALNSSQIASIAGALFGLPTEVPPGA